MPPASTRKPQAKLDAGESGWRQVSLKADIMDEVRKFLDSEYARLQHLETPRDLIERTLLAYWLGIGWTPGKGFAKGRAAPDPDLWRRPI